MSEARILAAFYQPKSKRFVSLTTDEVAQRCGLPVGHPDARSLIARGIILRQRLQGVNKGAWAYHLSPGGERRVLAMVVVGTLPRPFLRLTAVHHAVKNGKADGIGSRKKEKKPLDG